MSLIVVHTNVFLSHTGAWDSSIFLLIRTVFSTDVVNIGRELKDSLIDVAHPLSNVEINAFVYNKVLL